MAQWIKVVSIVWLLSLMACSGGRASKVGPTSLSSQLAGFTEPPRVQAILEESAASIDIMVRAKGLHALVWTDAVTGAGVWAPRGLWDPEPWVQWNTAEAMFGRNLNPESESLLLDLVQRESVSAQIRCPIAFRLGSRFASTSLPWIQPEYTPHGSGHAQVVCALTGWFLGDDAAQTAVETRLQDEGLPMDPYSFQLMAEMGERVDRQVLLNTMQWAEEGVDLHLAGVLARKGVPEGWERLQKALNSDDELEGLDSLDILLSIDSERVLPILRAHSNAETLAGVGASMYVEIVQDKRPIALQAYGSSEDRDERTLAVQMAARALEMPLSSRLARECRSLLTAGMMDEALVVRLETYQALRHHATADQLKKMADLLTQLEPSERLEVALAIRYRMSGH